MTNVDQQILITYIDVSWTVEFTIPVAYFNQIVRTNKILVEYNPSSSRIMPRSVPNW